MYEVIDITAIADSLIREIYKPFVRKQDYPDE